MKRMLVIFSLLLGIAAIIGVGAPVSFLAYGLTRLDPYPAFMEKAMSPKGPRTYEEARHAFSQFVAKTFPVGSDAKDAIAQITNAGFRIGGTTGLNSVELVWSRHAGPCLERYFVVVGKSADGKIADIAGQLYPACL